jgi:hypothetical protein
MASLRQRLDGRIEPRDFKSWDSSDRLWFYETAGAVALERLKVQLSRGVGANGRAMKPRIRAVLPDGSDGPVMEPHYDLSRVITLSDYRATDHGLLMFWHAGTGHRSHRQARKRSTKKPPPFGQILEYHAQGLVRGAPVRDVRLSWASIHQIKLEMVKRVAARRKQQARKKAAMKPQKPPGRAQPAPLKKLPPEGRGPFLIETRGFKTILPPKGKPGPPPKPVLPPKPPPPVKPIPVKPPPPPIVKPPPPPPPVKPPPPEVKPKVTIVPLPRPLSERIPKPTPIPAAPRPGEPILPGRSIVERMRAYTEGDRKVAALAEAGKELRAFEDNVRTLRAQREALQDQFLASGHDRNFPGSQRLAMLFEQVPKLEKELRALRERNRARYLEILKVPDPLGLKPGTDAMAPEGKSDPLTHEMGRYLGEAQEWLGAILGRGQNRPLPAGEASFEIGRIPPHREQRSFYWPLMNSVSMAEHAPTNTYVHEIAHSLEYRLTPSRPDRLRYGDTIRGVVNEFLDHRVGSETPVKLAEKFPTLGYGSDESGRKDRFDEAFEGVRAYYVGKEYPNGSTEVLAMGFERLYQDASSFAAKDPEFVKFLLGIADGSLR